MSLTPVEAWALLALLLIGLYLTTRRRIRKPMATWKRRGFMDYGDRPMDDSRSSIGTFKRMHRY